MIDIPDSIFPKDSSGNLLCPRCQKQVNLCDCPVIEPVKRNVKKQTINPIIRLDKSGRQGKIVTLIKNLPRNEHFIKDLAKSLKTKIGSGGTSYMADGEGVVEIQGDHKVTVEKILKSMFK